MLVVALVVGWHLHGPGGPMHMNHIDDLVTQLLELVALALVGLQSRLGDKTVSF